MVLNRQKELFSFAYIEAIASAAGFQIYRPGVDVESIDLTVATLGAKGILSGTKLDIQAKCTSGDIVTDDTVNFPLPVSNYEDLREKRTCPIILIVVTVPDSLSSWVCQDESELAMRHCGYWISLRDADETANTHTVTITIPRIQIFSPDALQGMMRNVSKGGLP